ncbi:MAG: HAD-IA family hydrolase [Patescibacteria group bacterium]|jgi:putative hydrolase of the HAD superfamily
MIKVILFDVDGVIVHTERFSIHFSREYNIPLDIVLQFFTGELKDCVAGKADLKVELKKYLGKWNWNGTVEDFLHYWFTTEHKIDQTLVTYVQKLRESGIRCYVATNQEKHRTQYMLKEMGFEKSFDGVFSSSTIGFRKPHKSFFNHILVKLEGVKPSEILFWDNSPEHVQVANNLGIRGEVYTNFPMFVKTMEKYKKVSR